MMTMMTMMTMMMMMSNGAIKVLYCTTIVKKGVINYYDSVSAILLVL